MNLPKVQYPTILMNLPSTGEQLKYRPFTVAEEKVLLTAAQTDDGNTISETIADVLEACFYKSVNVKVLPSFDIEYMFMCVRSKSVSEIIDIEYRNGNCPKEGGNECRKTFHVKVKIEDIKVQKFDPESSSYVNLDPKRQSKGGVRIMIDDGLGVMIKYPTMQMISDSLSSTETDYDQFLFLISECITSVFDTENVYTDFSKSEMKEWFCELTTKQKDPIQEFIRNLPMLRYEYMYKCRECGFEEKIEVEGLQNFL